MEIDDIVTVKFKVRAIRRVRYLGSKYIVTFVELTPVDSEGNPDLNCEVTLEDSYLESK
jgi:hypothetical protein